MAKQSFDAQRRTVLGKKVSQLRKNGRVPGIVYGPVIEETIPVSVDRKTFLKFYQTNGHSTLFDLEWEGGKESVFIREVQLHPVRREPLHIDFFAPNLRRPARAMVPLVLHNPVHTSEGVLNEERTQIEVEALPSAIPSQIDIDISSIQHPGDAIRVGDLTLPDSVIAITDANEIIVHMAMVYQTPEDIAADEAVAEAAESPAPEGDSEAPEGESS
jgi:large subunit ribosomal protein L25